MKKITCILLLLISSISIQAQRLSDRESNFFNINNFNNQSNVITIRNFTGQNNGRDSQILNDAIRRASNAGGGVIVITSPRSGNSIYLRSIVLRSNIHIQINSNVTIRPWLGGNPRSVAIFDVGQRNFVRNVAITNRVFTGPRMNNRSEFFKCIINSAPTTRIRMINAIRVRNFMFAGIDVTENNTILCNLEFNLYNPTSIAQGRSFPNRNLPVNGVVKNIVSRRNHVGYGITQIRAGRNILFRNLDGTGGATLRIESRFPGNIRSASQTINRIVGRNITIRGGDAAVFLSPHRNNQGRVDVSGINAFNSQSALFVEGGFLDGNASNAVNPNRQSVNNRGRFASNSFIGGFNRVIGGGAQVKGRDIPFYPCNQQSTIRRRRLNADRESRRGPSLAISRLLADDRNGCRNGCYRMNIQRNAREVRGLVGAQNNIDFSNRRNNCGSSKNLEDFQATVEEGLGTVLLENNSLNIYNSLSYSIYNITGKVIQTKDFSASTNENIDISNYELGVYIVKTVSANGTKTTKILIP